MTMERQEAYIVPSDVNEVEGGAGAFTWGRKAKALRTLQLRNDALAAELADMTDERDAAVADMLSMNSRRGLLAMELGASQVAVAIHARRVIAVTAERDAALGELDSAHARIAAAERQRNEAFGELRLWQAMHAANADADRAERDAIAAHRTRRGRSAPTARGKGVGRV